MGGVYCLGSLFFTLAGVSAHEAPLTHSFGYVDRHSQLSVRSDVVAVSFFDAEEFAEAEEGRLERYLRGFGAVTDSRFPKWKKLAHSREHFSGSRDLADHLAQDRALYVSPVLTLPSGDPALVLPEVFFLVARETPGEQREAILETIQKEAKVVLRAPPAPRDPPSLPPPGSSFEEATSGAVSYEYDIYSILLETNNGFEVLREAERLLRVKGVASAEVDLLQLSHSNSLEARIGDPPSPLWAVYRIAPTAQGIFGAANFADLGDGWKYGASLGYIYDAYHPWFFHSEHGFLYCYPENTDPNAMWIFDSRSQSWWFTGLAPDGAYPAIARADEGRWYWYVEGTTDPRWFMDLDTGAPVSF